MVFYVLGAAALLLLRRHRSRLTGFEQLALVGLLLAGTSAIRSIVWFSLAALLVLPRLLDGALSEWPRRLGRRPALLLAGAALAAMLVSTGVAIAKPSARDTEGWPAAAAERTAALVALRPGATVLADDRYADWLLWAQPALSGRIAYDIRFELLSRRHFEQIGAYHGRSPGWRSAIGSYDVLVVDEEDGPELVRALLAGSAYELAYRDPAVAVLARR
jgi:hypothetical protein